MERGSYTGVIQLPSAYFLNIRVSQLSKRIRVGEGIGY